MIRRVVADRFNTRGQRYQDAGDLARAEASYRRAARIAPRWSIPWNNLGLLFKNQRDWLRSLECNRKAVALSATNQPAWWNLGIAATALGDWPEARRAWVGFGLDLAPGEGPIEMDLGPTPIRLNPETAGEVVWCRRIDPARAIIRNVPLPESGHRFGDLLLHDGAPTGERVIEGRTVSVFDCIQLLQPSTYQTFALTLRSSNPEALQNLFVAAADADLGLEDWGSIRCLCEACSRGKPIDVRSESDDFVAPASHTALKLMAAAPDEAPLRSLLDAWIREDPNGEIVDIEPVSTPR